MLVSSIRELLERSYELYGKAGFLYTKEDNGFREYTRGRTIEDIWYLAGELLRRGYQDKKIMLIGENSYEWAVAYLAIAGYVGVAVLVDKDYTVYDYENIFHSIEEIPLIIYTELKEDVIAQIREQHPECSYLCLQREVRELLERGQRRISEEEAEAQAGEWNGNICRKESASCDAAEVQNLTKELPQRDSDGMCEIVFTSGTTSNPKAIMLSQTNILVNLENLLRRTPMNAEDVLYLILPMHHLYAGVHAYLYSYYTGLKIYLCRNMKEMVGDMQLVKPTVFIGVPMIYERILGNLKPEQYGSLKPLLGGRLKYVYCGGAILREETKRIYYDNGIELLDAYGVSEMSSVISFSYPGDEFNLSQGTVFENQTVEILDPDEEGVGEILVTGGNRMLGYYRNEAETAKKIDERGFLHTGDLGYLDEKNRLYIKGRKQRMIVLDNGKKVFPEEVEKLFLTYSIAKAVVYEEDGQLVARLVTDEPEERVAAIVGEVNEKLPRFKQIRAYHIKKAAGTAMLK